MTAFLITILLGIIVFLAMRLEQLSAQGRQMGELSKLVSSLQSRLLILELRVDPDTYSKRSATGETLDTKAENAGDARVTGSEVPDGLTAPEEKSREDDFEEPMAARLEADFREEFDSEPRTSAPTALTSAKGTAASSSFENLLGGRWSVLLGGVTVALGLIFLARYSIEAGLLRPELRIVSGAVFALALFVVGEKLRRKDKREDLPPFMSADIPGVLTAAAIVGAFATAFSAHSIYGFIGPATGLVLMTAIALASLLLSAVHGPKLAALGLLGAYATPFLVSSTTPSPGGLALHVAFVTAAVIGVAIIRNWRWLALGGVAGAGIWSGLLLVTEFPVPADTVQFWTKPLITAALLAFLAALFGYAFGERAGGRPRPAADQPHHRDGILISVMLSFLCATAIVEPFIHGGVEPPVPLVIKAVLFAIPLVMVSLWPSLSFGAYAAAPLGTLATAISFAVHYPRFVLEGDGLVSSVTTNADLAVEIAVIFGPSAIILVLALLRSVASAPVTAGRLSAALGLLAAAAPTLFFAFTAPGTGWLAAGLCAIILAMLMTGLTTVMIRARPDDDRAPAPAWSAVSVSALLASAVLLMLTDLWLPVSFGLLALACAMIYTLRPVRALPGVAVAFAAVSAVIIGLVLPVHVDTIGSTLLLNKLVLIVGLPAAAIVGAGRIFHRVQCRRAGNIITGLGLALAAFFVSLELRHAISGGQVMHGPFGLADMAAQTAASFGFAIGLQWLADRNREWLFTQAARLAGVASLLLAVLGLGLQYNPVFLVESVGATPVFNLLLPGYLLPAFLAGLVAWRAGDQPKILRAAYGWVGGFLLFLFVSLTVRHAWQDNGVLSIMKRSSDGELWTYSVVWLIGGLATLAAGIVMQSRSIRAASAVLILLTTVKVFLVDMSALTGALRAFSFIGLGLSLILIGRFYQRLLLRGWSRERSA